MAEYLIRYKDVQSQADTLQSIGKTLATFESRLNSIANAMDTRDNSMASLKAQVLNTTKQISPLANRVNSSGNVVSSVAQVYTAAEKKSYETVSEVKTVGLTQQNGIFGWADTVDVGALAAVTGAVVGASTNTKSSWWDKVKSGAKAVYDVGAKAVKVTGKVVSSIKEEIGPGGRFEGIWLAAKTTTKIVGASLLVTCSAASIALGNPAGYLGVIYGVNSLSNSFTDAWRINQGQYEDVGTTNYLKTGVEKVSEAVVGSIAYGAGYLVGGEDTAAKWGTAGADIGKTGGTIAYELGDIVAKVLVGKTVICNSNEVYTKIKDVMKLEKSSAVYGLVEKVVDWVDDPLKEIVKKVVPKSDTTLGEMAKKATEKVVSKLLKPIEVFS